MQKGKIVIVEGTSCVGKTTLCDSLKKRGWFVMPEAIRYLEFETGKLGDEASPIPGSQEEEEYYQDQLFRIEMKKIIEANKLKNEGKNVVIDKSAIATVATAGAFEGKNGFDGTFKRAYMKYFQMLQNLKDNNLIECDIFILLTAEYKIICERNKTRNHVLEGIWTEEETINKQREILEKMFENLVGKISLIDVQKKKIDTTMLTKNQVLEQINSFIQTKEERGER